MFPPVREDGRIFHAENLKRNSDMKEIIKDFMDENFTKREVLLYGVGYPLLLLAICVAAEWINSL